jgi:hypothetical protein
MKPVKEKYFTSTPKEKKRKGRSKIMINSRDEKLLNRFYYYSSIKKESYSKTILNLVGEFDICERVIVERLKVNQTKLDEIFNTKPKATELKRIIPYFSW